MRMIRFGRLTLVATLAMACSKDGDGSGSTGGDGSGDGTADDGEGATGPGGDGTDGGGDGGSGSDGGADQCTSDEECFGRGEYCDLGTNRCEADDTPPDSTGDQSGTFATMVIPFFRGLVCTKPDVQAGASVPFWVDPCLHPCLDVKTYRHTNFFECVGDTCGLWIVQWSEASGVDCPEDVFGSFSPDLCDYSLFPPAGKTINTTEIVREDGSPIVGTLRTEIPFLSNADIAEIAVDQSRATIKDKIWQYPQDPGRIIDMTLSADGPTPPAECDTGTCECFMIGF